MKTLNFLLFLSLPFLFISCLDQSSIQDEVAAMTGISLSEEFSEEVIASSQLKSDNPMSQAFVGKGTIRSSKSTFETDEGRILHYLDLQYTGTRNKELHAELQFSLGLRENPLPPKVIEVEIAFADNKVILKDLKSGDLYVFWGSGHRPKNAFVNSSRLFEISSIAISAPSSDYEKGNTGCDCRCVSNPAFPYSGVSCRCSSQCEPRSCSIYCFDSNERARCVNLCAIN